MHTATMTQTAQRPAQAVFYDVDRQQVKGFIEAFYQHVRRDALLGPVFSRVVADEQWPEHFETMTDFWMAVAFGGPAFRGNPMIKHARIRGISAAHFERWLAIFEEVAHVYWGREIADLLIFRAQQIAPALQTGVERAREKSLVTATDLH